MGLIYSFQIFFTLERWTLNCLEVSLASQTEGQKEFLLQYHLFKSFKLPRTSPVAEVLILTDNYLSASE